MEIEHLFGNYYSGKTVLVTGHTGFKGSWLCYWLSKMGANVIGFSNIIPTNPSHFELLSLSNHIIHTHGDIRDLKSLKPIFDKYHPEIIFHLAAQSLVRYSYENPVDTFDTNVMGTVNLLEHCRLSKNVKAVVIVTSDKCYENTEENRPFLEEDRMGGYDPYSCSKGVSELITSSYRNSYFNIEKYGINHHTLIATGRAGNVIGGGDWANDRLIPDIILSTEQDKCVFIRNPKATRPWQHVLEPLSGYLQLGQNLLSGNVNFAEGWNFGPKNNEVLTVEEVLTITKERWGKIQFKVNEDNNNPYEAKFLSLDCQKANNKMGWYPVWSTRKSIEKTVCWYQKYYEEKIVETESQLNEYIKAAKKLKYLWAI